jgi:hypothetical protein
VKSPAPCFLEVLESRIAPATFVVSTLKDLTDDAHDTGSLRDAIFLANANAAVGGDDIVFQTIVRGHPAPLVGKSY